MPSRKRVFSTGSERAEFEHVFGPLETDEQDARFVLVDEDTEKALRDLPAGIPPHLSQPIEEREKIARATIARAEEQGTEDVTLDAAPTSMDDSKDSSVKADKDK